MKKVKRSELATIRMVGHNEKKFSVVLMPETKLYRKRWVGFGWVDEGEASADDIKKYPVVVD